MRLGISLHHLQSLKLLWHRWLLMTILTTFSLCVWPLLWHLTVLTISFLNCFFPRSLLVIIGSWSLTLLLYCLCLSSYWATVLMLLPPHSFPWDCLPFYGTSWWFSPSLSLFSDISPNWAPELYSSCPPPWKVPRQLKFSGAIFFC